jgi:hypothetical protein
MQHDLHRRLGALAAAGALTLGMAAVLGQPAAAAPTVPAGLSNMKVAESAPARQAPMRAEQAGGNRSYDINLDGWADITARQASTGRLNVYPHSQSFNGTATFRPAVTINHGWGIMNWLAPGYVNADDAPDILARHADGRLFVYPHSGTFSGTGTITAPTLLGFGWNIHDIVFLDDWNGDGFDDILARPRGGDEVVLYLHSGTLSGTSTYQAPVVAITGASFDTWESMTDVTGDGFTDLIFRVSSGELGVFDLEANPPNGQTYLLGFGWNINDRLLINDVDGDGWGDIVARRASNGNLYAYRHRGTWDPNNPTATFQAPVLLGFGWQTNDIIT